MANKEPDAELQRSPERGSPLGCGCAEYLFSMAGALFAMEIAESAGGNILDIAAACLASWIYVLYHAEQFRLLLKAWLLAP